MITIPRKNISRLRYRWIEMSEDFDVKQRTENIYERWRSENNKKLSGKHSKEDREALERVYNRINLDERRDLLMCNLKLSRTTTTIITESGLH
jgi:hypothetical protein